jgi:quercetin dioxygenase-like cupin family protein
MNRVPLSPTGKGSSDKFTGDVYANPICRAEGASRLFASLVRFTPSARSHWHSHANGQILHITEGIGVVVTRDGSIIRVRAGDTVYTPPDEEHWHGATSDNLMCHFAMVEGTADGDGTTWLEPVSEPDYQAAVQPDAS